MVLGIILGVLALLALVFLIIFNVRAASTVQKRSGMETQTPPASPVEEQLAASEVPYTSPGSTAAVQPRDPEVPQTPEASSVPIPAHDQVSEKGEEPVVEQNRTLQSTHETTDQADQKPRKSLDDEYRQALRQFSREEKQPERKSASSGPMADEEYRAALRSLGKRNQE
jgi:hypothetical protein